MPQSYSPPPMSQLDDVLATLPRLPERAFDDKHAGRVAHIEAAKTRPCDAVSSPISSSGLSAFGEVEERISVTLSSLAPVFCTALSGILAGYDTGIITDALVQVRGDLTLGNAPLQMSQREYLMSAATLGALVGSLFTGLFPFSRRWMFGTADLIYIAGAVTQAMSTSVWGLIAGRFVVGLAIGISLCIAPVYVQELAPARLRGRMAVFVIASVNLGQLTGYAIAAGLDHVSRGWRWLFGLGALPAAIQLYFLAHLPESPRILVRRGEVASAEAVLTRLHPGATPADIMRQVRLLQNDCDHENDDEDSTWARIRLLTSEPSNRRALIVAVVLQALQQLCGFNSFIYYGSSLFDAVGLSQPSYVGLVVAGTSLLFTLLAMRYIDSLGRRPILLWSIPAMTFGLVLASVSFYFLRKGTLQLDGDEWYPPQWSAAVLLSMLIYISAYAVGLGNVPWQQGELFPLEVRGVGVALASATNWAASFLVGTTYVPLMRTISSAGTYGVYAGVVIPGYLFCIYCYPETAGLSLEEVRRIFRNDFGVAIAARLRREKRTLRGSPATFTRSSEL
ncbi:general substrate transporter [Exidia glandulosa HHB12029]|uniref:General substrate transporter n=1 Tax=Exidia glandulosa HHB12029 TaxID=1314781 RepID=A0A165IPI8_EXIGL|nr:general substrate transporter [Exidia glandulosa HHB12029]